jgi:beta-glucanase (GH16 family)
MLGGTKDTLVDLSAAYHRYGVLWKPDEVTFFIDDNLVYKARKSDSGMAVWPFGPNAQGKDQDFYLILNLAMGGNFGGAVDSSLDAATLSVDWVRYYSVDGLGKVTNK